MIVKSGWRRLMRIWQSDTAARVDEELQFHFEHKVSELEALGLTTAQARARAEAEFGDVAVVKHSLREIDGRIVQRRRRAEWWESVAQDLRYVVRSLGRAPIFTATVVITLALGLGANAAIFSFLDRLFLQTPQGVSNAGTLHRLYIDASASKGSGTRSEFSIPEIRGVRDAAPAGVVLTGYNTDKVLLGRTNDAPDVRATFVEGDYFGVLGVRPILGRTFSPDEYRVEGQSMVAIISHRLWQQQFSGDGNVLGTELDLGSHRHVIVGVAPEGFGGLDLNVSDIWVPRNTEGALMGRAGNWYTRKDQMSTQVVARIPDAAGALAFNKGATQAIREVRGMNDSLGTLRIASIIEARGGDTNQKELAISTRLAGVAAVILLIACANVVNLLLARAGSRQREVALRLALGVSRRRLITQVLIESTVLALLSIAVALAVAFGTATALRTLLIPGVIWDNSVVNERVVWFTVVLALLTGLTSGIIPAWQTTRPNLSGALKASIRDGGRRRSATRAMLLVVQTALSIVLLAGAGVFVRSLQSVQGINLGYAADGLVYGDIRYDRDLQDRDAEIQRGLPEAAARLRRMSGVESVALSGYIPMNGMSWTKLFLPDRDSLPSAGGMERIVSQVSPEFFKTTGVQILRGRAFTDQDVAGRELVIAVNETMANNLWPGEDPLAKCIILGRRETPCRRVVGVVSPAHFGSLIEGPSQLYYLPLAQAGNNGSQGNATAIVVRAAPGKSGAVSLKMNNELSSFFGLWARPRTRTMGEMLAPQLRPWRTGAALFAAAGILALLVSAVGVYSSIAYSVSQRSQEMGVRVALGASAGNIMRLVVRDGVRVVVIGVALGLMLALALGKVVASMLYETSPCDPFVLIASTLTLLAVAVVACSIPAWRASRVDPLDAMRAE
ncbi:MAG: ADOP family duplicated permease [Gemmatimonas sp.]